MQIRPETSADFAAITSINQTAFDRAGEADLVNTLRQAITTMRCCQATSATALARLCQGWA